MAYRQTERLNKKIERGETVIGTHITLTDHSVTELMGHIGYDFVWIDWEHAAIDRHHIQNHLIAAAAAGIAGIVRVPWNDPVIVKPVLEMGPDGVVFPMIRTAEEARNAVASCRYPPKGIRGFGPRRANMYGASPNDEYLEYADGGFWRIMQIEHAEAVANLEEILSVDGVDTIVVGPSDLSGSIGQLTKTNHPEVVKLMDEIGSKCRNSGKPFGVSMGWSPAEVGEWKRRGVSWIASGLDTGLLYEAGANVLTDVKRIFGLE